MAKRKERAKDESPSLKDLCQNATQDEILDYVMDCKKAGKILSVWQLLMALLDILLGLAPKLERRVLVGYVVAELDAKKKAEMDSIAARIFLVLTATPEFPIRLDHRELDKAIAIFCPSANPDARKVIERSRDILRDSIAVAEREDFMPPSNSETPNKRSFWYRPGLAGQLVELATYLEECGGPVGSDEIKRDVWSGLVNPSNVLSNNRQNHGDWIAKFIHHENGVWQLLRPPHFTPQQ